MLTCRPRYKGMWKNYIIWKSSMNFLERASQISFLKQESWYSYGTCHLCMSLSIKLEDQYQILQQEINASGARSHLSEVSKKQELLVPKSPRRFAGVMQHVEVELKATLASESYPVQTDSEEPEVAEDQYKAGFSEPGIEEAEKENKQKALFAKSRKSSSNPSSSRGMVDISRQNIVERESMNDQRNTYESGGKLVGAQGNEGFRKAGVTQYGSHPQPNLQSSSQEQSDTEHSRKELTTPDPISCLKNPENKSGVIHFDSPPCDRLHADNLRELEKVGSHGMSIDLNKKSSCGAQNEDVLSRQKPVLEVKFKKNENVTDIAIGQASKDPASNEKDKTGFMKVLLYNDSSDKFVAGTCRFPDLNRDFSSRFKDEQAKNLSGRVAQTAQPTTQPTVDQDTEPCNQSVNRGHMLRELGQDEVPGKIQSDSSSRFKDEQAKNLSGRDAQTAEPATQPTVDQDTVPCDQSENRGHMLRELGQDEVPGNNPIESRHCDGVDVKRLLTSLWQIEEKTKVSNNMFFLFGKTDVPEIPSNEAVCSKAIQTDDVVILSLVEHLGKERHPHFQPTCSENTFTRENLGHLYNELGSMTTHLQLWQGRNLAEKHQTHHVPTPIPIMNQAGAELYTDDVGLVFYFNPRTGFHTMISSKDLEDGFKMFVKPTENQHLHLDANQFGSMN